MSQIYLPSIGPTDWRRLLADPQKHWVRGKSAFECAIAWEFANRSSRGLPPKIADALDSNDLTRGASLLVALPEHKVIIEGGGHASQNDVWTLLRLPNSTASMAVEAKSGESFDKLVAEWLREKSINSKKPQRLNALKKILGIGEANLDAIRYQLLHRTASPLLEAKRFNASVAIMVVQSFGGAADNDSFKDFANFCALMGCQAIRDGLVLSTRKTDVPLFLGWIDCQQATDAQVAKSIE